MKNFLEVFKKSITSIYKYFFHPLELVEDAEVRKQNEVRQALNPIDAQADRLYQ